MSPTKPLRDHDRSSLQELRRSTVGHYEGRAEDFWAGTKDHDVTQNIAALLRHLCCPAPARILDLGCGPGRDVLALKELGHRPTGLDAAPAFARMARALSGCRVLEQDFLALELERASFDGIFANASLFHVPTQELPRVLEELRDALDDGGVLFASVPRGPDVEGYNQARYGAFLEDDTWRAFLRAAGFEELESYLRPTDAPPAQQSWFASVWRR